MARSASSGGASGAIEALLRDELAAADEALAHHEPVLRLLLRTDDNALYSDEIVARMRGLFADVASQLVVALADAAGHADPQAWAHDAAGDLARALAENGAFLLHFHALALEWRLTEQVQARLAVDPVVPPLVQAQLGATDPQVAARAMQALAAQARFGQHLRRMQLPLAELPGDLFHIALMTMRAFASDGSAAGAAEDGYALAAERSLRARFDEARGRLGLLRQMVADLGQEAALALALAQAGPALFLTALALGSGQPREVATLATTETQMARLSLMLRAAGLGERELSAQILALHPEVALPAGIDTLPAGAAAAILAGAGR